MLWAIRSVLAAGAILTGGTLMAVDADSRGGVQRALPKIATTVERVGDNVSTGVVHGWHSNHLLMHQGVLYADGRVPDPGANNEWKCSGAFWRKKPRGKWEKLAVIPQPPYLMAMGTDGRMWQVAPSGYKHAEVLHMARPLDFDSFEMPYDGTSVYMGASVSPGGNFLILHAETSDKMAFKPNALVSAFYQRETDTWHKGRFVTPEGRYGYIGILLKGRKALAVLNSTIADPEAVPDPPHYSSRHVRLARSDDLTKGQWLQKPFLMPAYGDTHLQDFVEAPNGSAYLSYQQCSSDTSYADSQRQPLRHYIAKIKLDLTADVSPTGIEASATRILFDTHGNWYLVGRPSGGGDLHLWALDSERGFKPKKEYELPGTDKLEGYVIHTLCPARFGSQVDGNTIHLLTARYLRDEGTKPTRAELWYARFDLPSS